MGASGPVFGSHYQGGLASAVTSFGSLRVKHRFVKSVRLSRTPQRFWKPLPASSLDSNMRGPRIQALLQPPRHVLQAAEQLPDRPTQLGRQPTQQTAPFHQLPDDESNLQ